MEPLPRFKVGALALIGVEGLTCTEDGFAVGGSCRERGAMFLYETIRLESYPSSNDFFGNMVKVTEGDLVLITEFLGRPWGIRPGTRWECYDVYEVIIGSSRAQAFSLSLRPFISKI